MKRAAGGAGGDRKRRRKCGGGFKFTRAIKHTRLFVTPDDVCRGVLATFDTALESRGVTEYATQYYGPPAAAEESSSEDEEAPQKTPEEVAKQQQQQKKKAKRLRVYDAGCSGVVAVRIADEKIEPVELLDRILRDIAALPADQQPKIKSLQRVTPIEAFCAATASSLKAKAEPLLLRHFGPGCAPKKFAIVFRRRNNETLGRDEAIATIAGMIEAPHSVDLADPDTVVVVEVFKAACGVSVVQGSAFRELHKYNIREIIKPQQQEQREQQEGGPTAAEPHAEAAAAAEAETAEAAAPCQAPEEAPQRAAQSVAAGSSGSGSSSPSTTDANTAPAQQ
eukprot:m51a1_g11446 hypothetical protein (337) ;mRNA; r:2278-3942